jgi:leader peptidase (prepilin peptidase) / N-methyltransferase
VNSPLQQASLDEAKGREPIDPAVRRIPPRSRTPEVFTVGAIGVVGLGIVLASLGVGPGLPGLIGAALGLLMLAIAVVDARIFIIPDGLTIAALLLALADAATDDWGNLAGMESVGAALLRGGVVAGSFLAIDVSYRRLRGRQGLGMGDVKLAGVGGAWLGWTMIPIAVELAALAAIASYLVRSLMSGRPFRATTRLPFGLFFAPAIWLCWMLEAMLFGSTLNHLP